MSIEKKTAYLGFLEEILQNHMQMPMHILWIIAEDDEDELAICEVFMFNTAESEEKHVIPKGPPGWQPAGKRMSIVIADDMHAQLNEKNTSTLEPLTRGKTLTPYMNGFIDYILPMVGNKESNAWLDFN